MSLLYSQGIKRTGQGGVMLAKKNEIIILESYSDNLTVTKEKTVYSPAGTVYLVFDNELNIETTRRWQNRYAKAISRQRKTFKGLVYWQERALKAEEPKDEQ